MDQSSRASTGINTPIKVLMLFIQPRAGTNRLFPMIIDGKKIAQEIIAELVEVRASLPTVVRLGVLMSEGDKVTVSFVKIKERVADRLQVVVVREMVGEDTTDEQALRAMERLVKSCEGVIVQRPLPQQLDTEEILKNIPPSKDADALGQSPNVLAPVAQAVKEILIREAKPHGFEVSGKKAVVVGEGRLVGKPVAEMLRADGAHVQVVTLEQGSLSILKDADVVVSGAGSPNLIKPEMLKEGVVLIDAGTSENVGKATASSGVPPKAVIVGDCDPRCAEVASVFTPVPGGVGPVAVAMLFKNLFNLVEK